MASWRNRKSELALLVGGALTAVYFCVPDGASKNSIYGLVGFLAVVAIVCCARDSVPWLLFAAGNLLFSIGDDVGAGFWGGNPPVPSIADAFYLGFFPLAYVAVVLFMRGQIRKLTTPSWLDGAVAGLGAAAACAAFAFHSIVHLSGGSNAATATNLAYPIADVLLLSLVVGGSTLMSGRRKAPWLLMAVGMAVNVTGDTANLFSSSLGRVGFVLDAVAWPAAILLLSMSVWLRPRSSNPLIFQRPNTFAIPGLSATCALLVLFVGNLHATSRVAVGLATATLILVGIRLILSVRAMRALSLERRNQAVSDELTGLGNRRCLSMVLDAFFADYEVTAPERRSLRMVARRG